MLFIKNLLVGVGLLAGLVGRPETNSNDDDLNPSKTTTIPPTTTPVTEKPLGPWDNIRLPLNLVPYHYDVELKPDLQPDSEGEYWFTGTSSVDFTVATETNFIYIHCNKLDITSLSLISDEVCLINTFCTLATNISKLRKHM